MVRLVLLVHQESTELLGLMEVQALQVQAEQAVLLELMEAVVVAVHQELLEQVVHQE